jgi:hypothetical protein
MIGFNIVLGLWLLVSPFAFGYDSVSPAMWNDIILGLLVMGCSWCATAETPGQVFFAVCDMLFGIWLLIAPMLLSYRLGAYGNEAFIGALLVVISAIETWHIMHRPPNLA